MQECTSWVKDKFLDNSRYKIGLANGSPFVCSCCLTKLLTEAVPPWLDRHGINATAYF